MIKTLETILQWIKENADIIWKIIVAGSIAIVAIGIWAKHRKKEYVD